MTPKPTDVQTCSICTREYMGYGHTAQPVNVGRCCDDCNQRIVIPARLRLFARAGERRPNQ